jgi:hypothetical protein
VALVVKDIAEFTAQEEQEFLVNIVLPKVKPGQIVIFDESKFRSSEAVQAAFDAQKTKLVSLPSWSPFLSPAEEIVASSKRMQQTKSTTIRMHYRLKKFLTEWLYDDELMNIVFKFFYTKVRQYLPAALAKQRITVTLE